MQSFANDVQDLSSINTLIVISKTYPKVSQNFRCQTGKERVVGYTSPGSCLSKSEGHGLCIVKTHWVPTRYHSKNLKMMPGISENKMVANVPLVLMLGMGSSKFCPRDFTVERVSLSSTENTSFHVSDKQNELQ